MSVCFLASLATSSRMALTKADVERLVRGLSDMGSSSGSARLCWEATVEADVGRSKPPRADGGCLYCCNRGLP